MKKKILFVIGSFNAGGAEKSMISQLCLFDKRKFDVYICTFKRSGPFLDLLPNGLKETSSSPQLDALVHKSTDIDYFRHYPILWTKKILRTILAKLTSKGFDINQRIWRYWKDDIPELKDEFDVAVGHMEGLPNYFVMDKVHARRKILWIHSEYGKLGYNTKFDSSYFKQASAVVTISQICKEYLQKKFPQLHNFEELHNISSPDIIIGMSKLPIDEPYFSNDMFHIVSVGRLVVQKNYPLAIKAARLLKSNGIRFNWIIIGDGNEKKNIQRLIESYGLQLDVILIGLKSNPYKYMQMADVIVQSSSVEGKSIVIDEAKILKKIVVATNYNTIKDSITDNYDGIITEMTPESLANGISRALMDFELTRTITSNLEMAEKGNIKEIVDYYRVYGL